jgi:hypothetical protein
VSASSARRVLIPRRRGIRSPSAKRYEPEVLAIIVGRDLQEPLRPELVGVLPGNCVPPDGQALMMTRVPAGTS